MCGHQSVTTYFSPTSGELAALCQRRSIQMSVQIRGRQYVTVAERLAQVYESGKDFEMVESAPLECGDRWVWRVVVRIAGGQYIGNAEVHLDARPGSADSVDCWACAETSAVGRALAFAGFLAIESIASADEIVRGGTGK